MVSCAETFRTTSAGPTAFNRASMGGAGSGSLHFVHAALAYRRMTNGMRHGLMGVCAAGA
jgi:hypothetical protein